jgi:hypothetical protein
VVTEGVRPLLEYLCCRTWYQSLDSSTSIRPDFGVKIKVPSSLPKTQFNISAANTSSYTCTSSESSFMIKLLKGVRQILSEFGFQHQHPTRLWCDNQSAIKLAKDPVQHQCSKHIELHMHFIRKLIHDQVIEVLFCPTEDQVADIFTKSLTEAKFSKLRSMLGVQEVVIKGGYSLMPHSFSYLCHYCKSFNPIPSCS